MNTLAESVIWFILILGEFRENEAQFLAPSRRKEGRYLVGAECDEAEGFVKKHWLVFLIASSILALCALAVIIVIVARHCCRSKKKSLGSCVKLVDVMAAAEDSLEQSGWFFGHEGKAHGPFAESEIDRLLDEGVLFANSKVTLANVKLATLLHTLTKVNLAKDSFERNTDALKHQAIYIDLPADSEWKSNESLVLTVQGESTLNSVSSVEGSRLSSRQDSYDTVGNCDVAKGASSETSRPTAIVEEQHEEETEVCEIAFGDVRSPGTCSDRDRCRGRDSTATSQSLQEEDNNMFGADSDKQGVGFSPKGKKLFDRPNGKDNVKILAPKRELEPDKENELKDIFNAFDLDRTGAVCYKNLLDISKSLGKGFIADELRAALHDADRNGDGEVNYREFVTYMRKENSNCKGPFHMLRPEHCRPPSLEEMFEKFDEDQTGSICFKNLVQISRRFGKDFTDDDIRHVIGDADRNGDGEINFKEFKRFMHKISVSAGTPLHIFTNYTEADEIRRALQRGQVAALAPTMDDARAQKHSPRNPTMDDARAQKHSPRNPTMDDARAQKYSPRNPRSTEALPARTTKRKTKMENKPYTRKKHCQK